MDLSESAMYMGSQRYKYCLHRRSKYRSDWLYFYGYPDFRLLFMSDDLRFAVVRVDINTDGPLSLSDKSG